MVRDDPFFVASADAPRCQPLQPSQRRSLQAATLPTKSADAVVSRSVKELLHRLGAEFESLQADNIRLQRFLVKGEHMTAEPANLGLQAQLVKAARRTAGKEDLGDAGLSSMLVNVSSKTSVMSIESVKLNEYSLFTPGDESVATGARLVPGEPQLDGAMSPKISAWASHSLSSKEFKPPLAANPATPKSLGHNVVASDSRRTDRTDSSGSHFNGSGSGGHLTEFEVTLYKEWENSRFTDTLERSPCSGNVLHKSGADSRGLRAGQELVEKSSILQKLVVKPTCNPRMLWDLLSFLMISYDVVAIPLMVFPITENIFMINMETVTLLFWTIDCVGSFFVGFNHFGVLEMRPKMIAKRYLQTWFTLDVSIVLADWFLRIFETEGSGQVIGVLRMGKSLRIVRVLRVFRLLRVVKLLSTLEQMSDFIGSEYFLTMFGIIKMLVAIVVVNHFIACGWYGLADLMYNPAVHNWIQELERATGPGSLGELPDGRYGPTASYRYVTSLHWSMTQFTPASMEVVPENVTERVFCLGVILFALVSFSTFVSSITNSMTRLKKLNEEQERRQEDVRRYITDNQVSMELGNRIYGFLRQRGTLRERRVHETDVEAFRSLPDALSTQLRQEVFLPVLKPYPLFFNLQDLDTHGMARICSSCVDERVALPGHVIFQAGGHADAMLVIIFGNAHYFVGTSEEECDAIENNEPACEQCMWLEWDYLGRLVSQNVCEMLAVRAADFREVAVRMETRVAIRAYALRYAETLENARASSEAVTDLWFDFDRCQELTQLSFEVLNQVDADLQIEQCQDTASFGGMTMVFRRMVTSHQGQNQWTQSWSPGAYVRDGIERVFSLGRQR